MPITATEIELIQRFGRDPNMSQRDIAEALGIAQSTVNKYLVRLPPRDYPLPPPAGTRQHINVSNGLVMIGSDAHYWPGEPSTAHRAFVMLCRDLDPDAVILNGDVIDGARISKHAAIGWEKRPKLIDELTAAKARLAEILEVTPQANHIWTLGNHDMRFETNLATHAPEYEGICGMHLKDHFPAWTPCWSCWLNDNTVVKHRFKGGDHAGFNNSLKSGLHTVTGHDHVLSVAPVSDYRGVRYGVRCGTLAEPYGPQFVDYTEDNPVNWQSGFVVLTYHEGLLLPPEPCYVIGPNRVAFRGSVLSV